MSLLIQLFNVAFTYPIVNVLMELYHLLHDFGLSIVLLTVIVYLVTLPFTLRQLKITRARRALQPQLAEIGRRYPNDLLARTAAEQEFLKQHGISTTSSLGPMIFQMLILSGLFFALNMILSHATLGTINGIMYPFLAHLGQLPDLNLNWFTFFNATWRVSLSQADPTHILPVLTGIVTFIQMRMAQPLAETRETVMQTSQMLQLIGPLIGVGITMFFVWQFAAGVALYRLVYLTLTAIQQYFMNGWGSLWVMPSLAGNGASIKPSVTVPSTGKARKRRRGGGSARRRGKHRGKR
jgi:YidC/Oxa1 family membrane protein insertase